VHLSKGGYKIFCDLGLGVRKSQINKMLMIEIATSQVSLRMYRG
jgi:hypothetical protein